MAKLLDITGKAISGEWGTDDETGNGVPVLRTTNFTNTGVVDFSDVVTRNLGKKDLSGKYLRHGDIIIEKSGGSDKQPVGRVIFFDGPENTYLFNNFTGLLRVKDQHRWAPRYVFYALFANYRRGGTKPYENRTTGLHNLQTDSYLSSMIIPDASWSEQQNACEALDGISAIIQTRLTQLRTLDTLIKARFVEMFGDPEINPYGWLMTGFTSIVNGKATNGYFAKREEYVDDGNVAILGVAYVVNRMYSQVTGLPRTNASEVDIKKHQVRYGDMLFCRSSLVAEGIGKASIVPEEVPLNTLFECHVIRIPLDLNKCVPEFMQVLSTTSFFRKQMIAQSKTATMTTIGQDGILKANIILPPIEKQQEFYSFVKQVDKSKVVGTVQQGLSSRRKLKVPRRQQKLNCENTGIQMPTVEYKACA